MTEPNMYQDVLNAFAVIRSAEIDRAEAKRTILCEPHREHQIRAAIDQAGAADVLTVKASPFCPEGQLLVIDEGAIEAGQREWIQGMVKNWRMQWP